MSQFLSQWQAASITTLGLFWMAFWAFSLGYLISAIIQVFVTKDRMQKYMGGSASKGVALGTFFGFLSSSCSFSALSTTRTLFSKGAGLIPSLAFLLASTNLVVELGVVIAIYLGWQFVVGEYVGGILLILTMWFLVKVTRPRRIESGARERVGRAEEGALDVGNEEQSWKSSAFSKSNWRAVASKYVMEWKMVWKDVTIGFTVAGIVATFFPSEFFQSLFWGAGKQSNSFLEIFAQAVVGPVAAFFTFIGSMGNIPLAAVLFGEGVSFAGVMAFIFSDLVVFPVLRIQAMYYGWKMAIYILLVFLVSLVAVAITLHYGFEFLGMLPDSKGYKSVTDRRFFNLDYTAFFNFSFVLLSVYLLFSHLKWRRKADKRNRLKLKDWIFMLITVCAAGWLVIGVAVLPLVNG